MSNSNDSYPISPLQQGMLYHSLSAPGSGVDIEQILCTVQEPPDLTEFKRAWDRVVERHPILRTRFQYEGLSEPLQVVEPHVNLELECHNWREFSPGERRTRIEEVLHADRLRGFEMTQAPMMRLAVFEIGESEYQFLWTFHHALLDGRSFSLVLKEFFSLYEAFAENRDLELEQPLPYRDYIQWLQQRDLSQDEVFWRQQLKGFTAPTPLAVPGPTSGDRVKRGVGAEEMLLPATFTSALQSFARDHELTLNTLIQGAWALLLHHYSGTEDVVFGATRACRRSTVDGAESMIGLFINTLPMRVWVSPTEPLLSWLKQLRKQQVRLRKYENTPLSKVQQWSDVPSGLPLFESIVVFEKGSLNSTLRAQGDGWFNREFLYRGQTNYPLTVIGYADKELLLRIEYDQHRFAQTTVRHMLGHVRTLLEGMITSVNLPAAALPYVTSAEQQQLLVGWKPPWTGGSVELGQDRSIAALSILPEQERHKLLIEWNDTSVEYPRNECLHQLFETQVKRTPEAMAVVYEGTALTYRQLNCRANQLGHYLETLGVEPETLVGLFMERSLEMVIGIYGILKAGGAYVPLDPEYPPDRVAYMIEDTQVSVLLTQEHLVASLPENGAKVVCLDSDWNTIAKESANNLASRATAENLAYVIYTSGSTGKPKGVMNEHRGICNRLLWMQDQYGLTEEDRILQKTPFSFDVSVWEFFWPLLVGACLIVARPRGHKDSAYLVKLIIDQEITTLHFVPSMLQIFLEEKGVENCLSLKRVICSGEALPYELQKRFFERLNTELHNLYGPTEAAVDVTYWACQRESDYHFVPIGFPVANTQIYILNPQLQPAPIGVSGELHIGGVQVARGYLNRPELTAEKFIHDPFNNKPGARLYKTGDLARYFPDGSIEYLSRIDHQVKIRGFRIELGEIEIVLSEHETVGRGVVIVREDRSGDKRLVAYVVSEPDHDVSVTELFKHLRTKLPEYMIPQHFVELDALPLTPSGKVDRHALPAPQEDRQTEETYVAPQNEVEKVVARIWQELLRVKNIGIHDSFFELGGHSLLLVRMLHKLQESFAKELSIVEMFQHPTIETLAKFLTQKQKKARSFATTHDLVKKQKESLKRQKRLATARR